MPSFSPAKAGIKKLWVHAEGRGTLWLDDVRLVPINKGTLTEGEPFALKAIPAAPAKPAAHTTLLAHFDGTTRPDADYARWNPISAGPDAGLARKGKFGVVVAITDSRACVIFGGEDSCPTAQGLARHRETTSGLKA